MDEIMQDVGEQASKPLPPRSYSGPATPALEAVDSPPPLPSLSDADVGRARRLERMQPLSDSRSNVLPPAPAPSAPSPVAVSWSSRELAAGLGLAPVLLLGYLLVYSLMNTAPAARPVGEQVSLDEPHQPNQYSLGLFGWLMLLPIMDVGIGAAFNGSESARIQWPDIPQLFVPDSCSFAMRGQGSARVPFDISWWPSIPTAVVTTVLVAAWFRLGTASATRGQGAAVYMVSCLLVAFACTVGSRWFLGCDGGAKGLVTGVALGGLWGMLWMAIDAASSASGDTFRRDAENFWNLRLLSSTTGEEDRCTAYAMGGTSLSRKITGLEKSLAAAKAEVEAAKAAPCEAMAVAVGHTQRQTVQLADEQAASYDKTSTWFNKNKVEGGVFDATRVANATNEPWNVGGNIALQRVGGGSAPPGEGTRLVPASASPGALNNTTTTLTREEDDGDGSNQDGY